MFIALVNNSADHGLKKFPNLFYVAKNKTILNKFAVTIQGWIVEPINIE